MISSGASLLSHRCVRQDTRFLCSYQCLTLDSISFVATNATLTTFTTQHFHFHYSLQSANLVVPHDLHWVYCVVDFIPGFKAHVTQIFSKIYSLRRVCAVLYFLVRRILICTQSFTTYKLFSTLVNFCIYCLIYVYVRHRPHLHTGGFFCLRSFMILLNLQVSAWNHIIWLLTILAQLLR